MNQKIINVIMFAAGAAIGSLVTWKIVQNRYEQTLQEEIDSFKESYAMCMCRPSTKREEPEISEDTVDDEDGDEYNRLADEYRTSSRDTDYTDYCKEGGGDDEVPYINGPYVIKPEDFADGNFDHDCYCITYYADGVLADDWYNELDIEETIGEDAIEHFDDHAEDVVHVRNERLKADYEVTRDPRRFSDVIANDPHMHMHAT